jgi:hypothetical protein
LGTRVHPLLSRCSFRGDPAQRAKNSARWHHLSPCNWHVLRSGGRGRPRFVVWGPGPKRFVVWGAPRLVVWVPNPPRFVVWGPGPKRIGFVVRRGGRYFGVLNATMRCCTSS